MKELTKSLSIILATTVAPFEQNGTTLVPLRIVSENLGATVNWKQKQ